MKNINENVINKMKKIVKNKSAMKIDGVMVDLYTASAVTKIYDIVNPANKKKMEKMSPQGLATAAFKILGKKESVSEAKATPEEKAQLSLKHARETDTLKDRQEREKETLMQREDASGMNPKQKMKFDQLMKKLDGGKEHMKFKRMAKNSVQGDDMFHGYVKDLAMKEQNEKEVHVRMDNLGKKDEDKVVDILQKYEKKGVLKFDGNTDKGVSFKLLKPAMLDGLNRELKRFYTDAQLNESIKSVVTERKLTDAEMDKREKVAKAIEKDNPDMPMGKKMAIATNVAKGVQMENDEYDNEGGMALSQLRTAKSAVEDLMSSIKEMDNLPEWVQSKLTKAVDYMDSVRDYMASEEGEEPVNEINDARNAELKRQAKAKAKKSKLDLVSKQKKQAIDRLKSQKRTAKMGGDIAKDSEEMKRLNKTYADKVQKIMQEENVDESMARARADARRHMGGRGAQRGMAPLKKDVDNDATDGDRKAASKHIIQQLRKAADLPNGAEVEFKNGKGKVDRRSAQMVLQKYLAMKKPMDKEKFQASIKSLADVKKILGR